VGRGLRGIKVSRLGAIPHPSALIIAEMSREKREIGRATKQRLKCLAGVLKDHLDLSSMEWDLASKWGRCLVAWELDRRKDAHRFEANAAEG